MEAFTIWLTGRPGAGKSTLAVALKHELTSRRQVFRTDQVHLLDGDVLRASVSADLGFSPEDRATQADRTASIAAWLNQNGQVALVALVSPFRVARLKALARIPRSLEVHVKCSLETARIRDPKGLYKAQAEGRIQGLTGVDQAWVEPLPDDGVMVDTQAETVGQCVLDIMEAIHARFE